MKLRYYYIVILVFLIYVNNFLCIKSQNSYDISEVQFVKPDVDHYPETWYHFIGGNVSKEGITADLEAIAEAGISGIQLFHGQFGGEWPGVSPQIQSLSEDWDDLDKWTATECKRLNLRFTMQNCPGWSYAGGPWIEHENSMRHLVYSRTDVDGEALKYINLKQPEQSKEEWQNYKDLFVIAFPTPEGDTGTRLIPSEITGNRSDLLWTDCLIDGKRITIKPSLNEPTVVDIKFPEKTTLRTVEFPPIDSYAHAWVYAPGVKVKVYAILSDEMHEIASIDMPSANWQDDKPFTIACSEVSSDTYRVEIVNMHDMALSYINFYSAARQQNWESEAAWTLRRIVREDYPVQVSESWIDPETIVDITERMDSLGRLAWDAPEGRWTILRIGHVNTGQKNGPAPPEATGWEATKLNKSGIRANFEGYIGRLIGDDGVLKDGLLQGVLLDSWECKTQTWTQDLDKIFDNKWNYSLHSMFPALFGYVVGNQENTARFLRDWRVTLNDLLVENFFGEMKTLAEENNLKVSFETASGDVFPGDILEYYKYADIPMCEFWQPRSDSFVGSIEFKPVKPTVSAARGYGKKRVAAEALTSFELTWNEHPRFLKDIADDHFAKGVTHLVFHTYTHNPRTDFLPPSTSFGTNIGTPFLRLQTWWKHMPLFTDYLARCNYLLEAGNPVSDVLMYLGDEQNHKPPQLLPFPDGYLYDYCNPDMLLNRLSMSNGKLVTPEGIQYSVLWLYDCKRMLPETLEKIAEFVEDGLIVAGDMPMGLATLSGGDEAVHRFNKAVEMLWANGDQNSLKLGKGKVYNTSDINLVLMEESLMPDIMCNDSDLRWLHRQTNESDIYFISTLPDKGFKGIVGFRSKGNVEIWNPLTGDIVSANANVNDEYTEVELDIMEGNSCFVVINNKELSKPYKSYKQTAILDLTNVSWQIDFPSGWGTEGTPIFTNKLLAWRDLPLSDEGKSFSGTAIYDTDITLSKLDNNRYYLNLGKVEFIAKVSVNGEDVGTRWTSPYKLDVTDFLKQGVNRLRVEVTSTWFNRLVYDAGLDEKERKTWTIAGPAADMQLKEYGMLGPVYLEMESIVD